MSTEMYLMYIEYANDEVNDAENHFAKSIH